MALVSNDVGVFPIEEARNAFVGNLMTEIIKLFQSPALHGVIFKEAKLYRELAEMLIRFQNSFGIRDLMRTGEALFEQYLNSLYQFTVDSFQTQNPQIRPKTARLNQLWLSMSALRMSADGAKYTDRLEEITKQLI